jgi:hypothetical protein
LKSVTTRIRSVVRAPLVLLTPHEHSMEAQLHEYILMRTKLLLLLLLLLVVVVLVVVVVAA